MQVTRADDGEKCATVASATMDSDEISLCLFNSGSLAYFFLVYEAGEVLSAMVGVGDC